MNTLLSNTGRDSCVFCKKFGLFSLAEAGLTGGVNYQWTEFANNAGIWYRRRDVKSAFSILIVDPTCQPSLQILSKTRRICHVSGAGWSSLVARRAHNPKVVGRFGQNLQIMLGFGTEDGT
jgi:hypothetical protein